MALKRVFAGFYKRYDGKPIFVVRVPNCEEKGEFQRYMKAPSRRGDILNATTAVPARGYSSPWSRGLCPAPLARSLTVMA